MTGALTQLNGIAGCVSEDGTGGACAIGNSQTMNRLFTQSVVRADNLPVDCHFESFGGQTPREILLAFKEVTFNSNITHTDFSLTLFSSFHYNLGPWK